MFKDLYILNKIFKDFLREILKISKLIPIL